MYYELLKLASTNKYYELPIQKGAVWSMRTAPHALISGQTGFGKSYFVNYLTALCSIKGNVLYLCDPKNSDISSLSDYMPKGRVESSKDGICHILDDVIQIMEKRYDYMKTNRLKRNLFQADFVDFNLPVIMVVIDELASFVSSLEKKVRIQFESDMQAITLLGRQCGIIITNICQSPNSHNINTESRSQMGFRVFLGNSGGIEYRMLFGEGYSFPSRVYKPGQGLYMISGQLDSPELIETPRLDKSKLADTLKKSLEIQYALDPFDNTPVLHSCSEAKAEQDGFKDKGGLDYDAPLKSSEKCQGCDKKDG
ncbi:hypothetical protein [Anaerosporobacter sp.]|uniref:hypothetical protein n=1 Tax=Anaerosporobacter sp. TaxID=1872529 RepID=UPI00286ED465|nr:hypothetical protein [Anaerosporobacter sp.]